MSELSKELFFIINVSIVIAIIILNTFILIFGIKANLTDFIIGETISMVFPNAIVLLLSFTEKR